MFKIGEHVRYMTFLSGQAPQGSLMKKNILYVKFIALKYV